MEPYTEVQRIKMIALEDGRARQPWVLTAYIILPMSGIDSNSRAASELCRRRHSGWIANTPAEQRKRSEVSQSCMGSGLGHSTGASCKRAMYGSASHRSRRARGAKSGDSVHDPANIRSHLSDTCAAGKLCRRRRSGWPSGTANTPERCCKLPQTRMSNSGP